MERVPKDLDPISVPDLLPAAKDSSRSVSQYIHGCITQGNCSLCQWEEVYYQKDVSTQKIYALVTALCPNIHVVPDPRIYSTGRWLRWDKLERESRYIEFDFAALCRRAVELCPGAMSVASYEKKEGGYNKVFIFTMDNASRVVARLPTRISGPPGLTTNSEVATMKYCESRVLHLPTTQLLIFVCISAIQNEDPHTKNP